MGWGGEEGSGDSSSSFLALTVLSQNRLPEFFVDFVFPLLFFYCHKKTGVGYREGQDRRIETDVTTAIFATIVIVD